LSVKRTASKLAVLQRCFAEALIEVRPAVAGLCNDQLQGGKTQNARDRPGSFARASNVRKREAY
jgi:hypothetical protein